MNFDHQQFSRASKIALNDYLLAPRKVKEVSSKWFADLEKFDLDVLSADTAKMAFWINIYNGLTNFQIVFNRLKNSVFEKPDFFTDRSHKIGALFYALDDIEHGILRRNGKRRNGKQEQFRPDDPRHHLMVESFDYRIHFALNCGSISCPALSFYSEQN